MQILALDVGTSSVKAAVLDVESAEPVGSINRVGYELEYPTPDAAVIPCERLWLAVSQAARQCAEGNSVIEGIGFSCLTPALVLLDAGQEPISPVWTHLDRRARPVARRVWAEVGGEFFAHAGNRPLPGGISVLCYRQQCEEDPELPTRVKYYLHVNGWLALRLTGVPAFDRGNACFTGLYGTVTDRKWSSEWCRYFGIDPDWLPPVHCGSTTIGQLRADVAAMWGLPSGLPVKLGTADTSTAMLAAGMTSNDLLHVVGTTQVLAAFTDTPRPDPRRLTRQLGLGETYIQVTHNPVGGVALDWIRELCFREQSAEEFFERTISAALSRQTPVLLDPPYLGGDRLEIEPVRAAFRELSLSTDRLDLLAALLQTMERKHREALTNLGMGDSFQRIFLTGGGQDVLRRLIPEYRSDRVHLLEEGSLRGVARLFRL